MLGESDDPVKDGLMLSMLLGRSNKEQTVDRCAAVVALSEIPALSDASDSSPSSTATRQSEENSQPIKQIAPIDQ